MEPNEEWSFDRQRDRLRRLRVVTIITPSIMAMFILAYRFMAGDKDTFFSSSISPFMVLMLFGTSAVGALMFYLQPGTNRIREFAPDDALSSELRYEFLKNRDSVEMLSVELSSLKDQMNAMSASKEALTKEQTASLVDSVRRKIEADASKQYLEELRQSVQSDGRLREALAYSRETADRLNREVAALSRRGNLNLSLGIITTVGGLGILAYVVFQVNELPKETWALASHYVPRLSLVLFIELFAYFFLRLYKASLSEIKYFQNELTNVESKRLALIVALNQGDSPALLKVIEDLTKTERNFVLEKGQTTVELEKTRMDKEASVNLFEKAGVVIEKIQSSKK